MALRLLLFSSDENTALVLRQVLEELEFQVDHCSESLDAVEKVTTKNFDVIIVDWADDPEAGFLLKTARELKSTKESVALAVLPIGTTAAAALKMGAHETLKKPIIPSQVMDTLRTVRDVLIASHGASSETSRRNLSQKNSQHQDLDQEFIGLASKIAADLPRENTELAVPQPQDEEEEFVSAPSAPVVVRPDASAPAEHRPSQSPRYAGSLFASLPYATDSSPDPSSTKSLPTDRGRRFHSKVAVLSAIVAIAALLYAWAPGTSLSDRISVIKLNSINFRSMMTRLSSLGRPEPNAKAAQTKPDPTTPNSSKSSARAASGTQAWPSPSAQLDPFQVGPGQIDHAQADHAPVDHGAASSDAAAAGAAQTVSVDESLDNIQVIPIMDTPATITDTPATTSAGSPSDPFVPAQSSSGQSSSGLPTQSLQTAASSLPGSAALSSAPTTSASTMPTQSPAPRVVPDSLKTPSITNRASAAAKLPAPGGASSLHVLTVSEHATSEHASSEHASKLSAGPPTESVLSKAQPTASLGSARTGTARSTSNFTGALNPVVLSEETSRELLVSKVQPVYPPQAARTGLQGAVVLQALVGKDGSIRDLKLIRGYLVFGRAAFDAVKQWRYKPYVLNGQAVETQTQITVNFKPPS